MMRTIDNANNWNAAISHNPGKSYFEVVVSVLITLVRFLPHPSSLLKIKITREKHEIDFNYFIVIFQCFPRSLLKRKLFRYFLSYDYLCLIAAPSSFTVVCIEQ